MLRPQKGGADFLSPGPFCVCRHRPHQFRGCGGTRYGSDDKGFGESWTVERRIHDSGLPDRGIRILVSEVIELKEQGRGYSSGGAARQSQTLSNGHPFQPRDQDIVDRDPYIGGDTRRKRNFHQIESVELARQRQGNMARGIRMAGQSDSNFAALERVRVLGQLLQDFSLQIGAREEGQSQVLGKIGVRSVSQQTRRA